jgi:hypothetical protein
MLLEAVFELLHVRGPPHAAAASVPCPLVTNGGMRARRGTAGLVGGKTLSSAEVSRLPNFRYLGHRVITTPRQSTSVCWVYWPCLLETRPPVSAPLSTPSERQAGIVAWLTPWFIWLCLLRGELPSCMYLLRGELTREHVCIWIFYSWSWVDKILYNIALMTRVANDILLPVTLHSVNSVMSYYQVTL